jgi:hypothetical protein
MFCSQQILFVLAPNANGPPFGGHSGSGFNVPTPSRHFRPVRCPEDFGDKIAHSCQRNPADRDKTLQIDGGGLTLRRGNEKAHYGAFGKRRDGRGAG